MHHSILKLLGNPHFFLDKLFENLQNLAVDITPYELDHICYRVDSLERYEMIKQLLLEQATLLSESRIGGRPIASFKLKEPIMYQNRTIHVLELPSPKLGSYYPEGWEHVEFVIQEDFINFMAKYPAINFKTKGMTKAINPDIAIKFEDFTVKFHHQTLEYVIRYLD